MMRNLIIGLICGALLMASGQALAGTVTNVGKKIQAEYPVIVDGKAIQTKAVAINGTTYTPNAAIADAMDVEVKFQNKTVVFTTDLTDQLNIVNGQIMGVNQLMRSLEADLETNDFNSEEARQKAEQRMTELRQQLAELEAKKAELEAQP